MNAIDKILEHQQAWQALSADNEMAIRAAAREALSRCAQTVAVLSENLKEIGYPWVSVEGIPAEALRRNIQVFEMTTGLSLPKILVAFWQLVGGVSLIDLENYQHTDFWKDHDIHPRNGFADGLYIEACSVEWVAFVCDDYLDWQEYAEPNESEGFLLTLSPDGYHKDNISGGAPYGLLAESTWKPVWQNFEWPGERQPFTAIANPPDFLSYLRTTILECAGFPALLGIPAFEPIKERLLRGVPIF